MEPVDTVIKSRTFYLTCSTMERVAFVIINYMYTAGDGGGLSKQRPHLSEAPRFSFSKEFIKCRKNSTTLLVVIIFSIYTFNPGTTNFAFSLIANCM